MADAKKWIDDLPPVTLPMTGNENVMVSQAGIAKRMKTEDFFAIFQGYVKIDGSTAFGGNQSMGSNNLKDLAAPLDDNDAVRLIDVNTFIGALNSLNTEAKNNVVSAINEVLATANSKVVTVNSQTDQVQLDLSLTGGILSITGGTATVNLDIRYLKNTDSIDWGKIIGTPTTLGGYGIIDGVNKADVGDTVASLVNGVLPTSQLPALAITDTYVVASETAQLALTVQKGDIVVRTDLSETFVNSTGNNTGMSDWVLLEFPGGSGLVQSVNGQTGNVVLGKGDVGLGNVDNTSDVNKPVSTATQTALNLKANTSSLATVATSGSYDDLNGKPVIPAAQVNADWTADSGIQKVLNKLPLDKIIYANSFPATFAPNALYVITSDTVKKSYLYIDDNLLYITNSCVNFNRIGIWSWIASTPRLHVDDITAIVSGSTIFSEDFESALTGWTTSGSIGPQLVTDLAHKGIQSLITTGFGYMTKAFTNITEGTVNVWFYDDVTNRNVQLGITVDDGTHYLFIGVGVDNTYNNYSFRIGGTIYSSGINRQTGWHKFSWSLPPTSSTAQSKVYLTNTTGFATLLSIGNLTLDDILNVGNTSTKDITAGNVNAAGIILYGPNLKSIKSLGTDASGNIIKTTPAIIKKTANYTIAATDDIILGNTTAGGITFTLPNPGTDDMYFTIRNVGTTAGNLLTVTTSEAINATGTTSITLDINKVTRLRYSGGIWYEV